MPTWVPGPASPSLGFMDAGVTGDHVLCDPKEEYRRPKRGQTGSCYSSPRTKQPESGPGDGQLGGIRLQRGAPTRVHAGLSKLCS